MDELINKLRSCIAIAEDHSKRVHRDDCCDYDYGFQNGMDHMINIIEDILDEYDNVES